jgi:hypothetical protein
MDIDKIEVKGLTRGEIKKFRKEGIVLGKLGALADEKRDEALDKIFKAACPEFDADTLTQGEANDLYAKVVDHTYMTEADRKNLKSPRSSISKGGSTTVASAKKRGSKARGTARKSKKKRG